MSSGCAEMRMFRKIGYFVHFGETDDSPDTFKFYFQHNRTQKTRTTNVPYRTTIRKDDMLSTDDDGHTMARESAEIRHVLLL